MNILTIFLTIVHVIVAVFLVVLVLMQKSKDQGVGAAFGGAMTDTVFGANTTTALVRMTIWCACILLATSLILAVIHARFGGSSSSGGSLMEGVRPTAPAAPAAMPGQTPIPAESAMPAPSTAPATPAAPTAPVEQPIKTP